MNLSNQLTLSRFVLAFMMSVLLTGPYVPFGKTLGLIVFALAGLTDYLDGRLARSFKTITAFGQLMDPLADKVLVCSAFVSFAAWNQIVPVWIVVAILTREFLVTGLRLLAGSRGIILPAETWGKRKTIWQIVVIVIIILGEAVRREILPLLLEPDELAVLLEQYYNTTFEYLSYIISAMVAVITLLSGAYYFYKNRDLVMSHA